MELLWRMDLPLSQTSLRVARAPKSRQILCCAASASASKSKWQRNQYSDVSAPVVPGTDAGAKRKSSRLSGLCHVSAAADSQSAVSGMDSRPDSIWQEA